MVSLSNLTDQQNMLLTQLAYESDVLKDVGNNMTLQEILGEVSDPDTQKKLQQLCDAGLGSLRIKAVGNDSATGFGAIAFTDGDGNTGFSYRGTDGISTESINDWIDNGVAMITGTSAQSAQAEAFFDAYRDPDGDNYLYGHSKGGQLSSSVYVNNYSDIKGVHLLNPQPLNPYSLTPDQLAAMQSNKMDIVIVEGDYVWFLGALPYYGNIRIIKSNGGNPHVYDSIYNMYDENGNLIEGNQPWWEYIAYFAISRLVLGLQIVGATVGYVYNCIVRIIDFIRNDLIPAALEFIDKAIDGLKVLGEKLEEFMTELKEFLVETLNKVKNWFNSNFNRGYKYATANPQIKVDTYKLRDYASRLIKVNGRIGRLDGRLDGLYWKVGLLDLWDLMQADLMTGYSWRLLRAAGYLSETASEFEAAEKELANSL